MKMASDLEPFAEFIKIDTESIFDHKPKKWSIWPGLVISCCLIEWFQWLTGYMAMLN